MKKSIIFVVVSLVFLITGGNAYADLSEGLVAFYPFNGNANDESGNSYHGTVYGAIPSNDRFGNENNSYNFDGDNDYIISNPGLPVGNAARSVSGLNKQIKYF